ncbi:LuxR C-terminal-related transcriptional regulator [Scandinavium goeteborgense]|uniref:Regulatory LuxR family protein n=1 Tax=Scandinavium goeteborgense TaxID=1851514 RepID=A0A4R6EZP6_SCAGO|nr:LuxR C-terminal-related transcriptional regulator [Scandinavium goeteborgense]TDN64416.1 regulatory LuxR family protein [Scandinavium goeteborgense]
MLKIAIEDSNSFYKKGFGLFLEELFCHMQNSSVKVESLTEQNVLLADVIVKGFNAGAQFICHPVLKFRRRSSLIIGIYNGKKDLHHNGLPLCINDIIFISRFESLHSASEKISIAWKSVKANPIISNSNECLRCKHRILTPQQTLIAKSLLRGNDIFNTSKKLGIDIKTISAHKRLIMKRFGLKSDCELLIFLNGFNKSNHPIYLFDN